MAMNWERIREARHDLTDYVTHFTRYHLINGQFFHPKSILATILQCGFINPTFAPLPNRHSRIPQPTIKGPHPAVCLTEQPISAVLKTPHSRYSHYGIAFHKACLYEFGARPVLYGSESEIGRRLKPDDPGYQADKQIYVGGLPDHLQYLFVTYKPIIPGRGELYPVDFTWEREWRFKGQLPILLRTDWSPALVTIIVQSDQEIAEFQSVLAQIVASGNEWAAHVRRIISLETAARMLKVNDQRFARIESWPF